MNRIIPTDHEMEGPVLKKRLLFESVKARVWLGKFMRLTNEELVLYSESLLNSEEKTREDSVPIKDIIAVTHKELKSKGRRWDLQFTRNDKKIEWRLMNSSRRTAKKWVASIIAVLRQDSVLEASMRRRTRSTLIDSTQISRRSSSLGSDSRIQIKEQNPRESVSTAIIPLNATGSMRRKVSHRRSVGSPLFQEENNELLAMISECFSPPVPPVHISEIFDHLTLPSKHRRNQPVDLTAELDAHEHSTVSEDPVDSSADFEFTITPFKKSIWELVQLHLKADSKMEELKMAFSDTDILYSQFSTRSLQVLQREVKKYNEIQSIREILQETVESQSLKPKLVIATSIDAISTPVRMKRLSFFSSLSTRQSKADHLLQTVTGKGFFVNCKFWLERFRKQKEMSAVKIGFFSTSYGFKGSHLVEWVKSEGILDSDHEIRSFCQYILLEGGILSVDAPDDLEFREKGVYRLDEEESESDEEFCGDIEKSLASTLSMSELYLEDDFVSSVVSTERFSDFVCCFRNDEHLLLDLLQVITDPQISTDQLMIQLKALHDRTGAFSSTEKQLMTQALAFLLMGRGSGLQKRLSKVFLIREAEYAHALAVDLFWELVKRERASTHLCKDASQCLLCEKGTNALIQFVKRGLVDKGWTASVRVVASVRAAMMDEFWCVDKPVALGQKVLRPHLWELYFLVIDNSAIEDFAWFIQDASVLCSNPENAVNMGGLSNWEHWVLPFCTGIPEHLALYSLSIVVNVLYHRFLKVEGSSTDISRVVSASTDLMTTFAVLKFTLVTILQRFHPPMSFLDNIDRVTGFVLRVLKFLFFSENYAEYLSHGVVGQFLMGRQSGFHSIGRQEYVFMMLKLVDLCKQVDKDASLAHVSSDFRGTKQWYSGTTSYSSSGRNGKLQVETAQMRDIVESLSAFVEGLTDSDMSYGKDLVDGWVSCEKGKWDCVGLYPLFLYQLIN